MIKKSNILLAIATVGLVGLVALFNSGSVREGTFLQQSGSTLSLGGDISIPDTIETKKNSTGKPPKDVKPKP